MYYYRGKHKDKWICHTDICIEEDVLKIYDNQTNSFVEIEPTTLGSSIGKNDKNDTLIYTDDIIKIDEDSLYYKVQFDNDNKDFFFISEPVEIQYQDQKTLQSIQKKADDVNSENIEIIGNIFEGEIS